MSTIAELREAMAARERHATEHAAASAEWSQANRRLQLARCAPAPSSVDILNLTDVLIRSAERQRSAEQLLGASNARVTSREKSALAGLLRQMEREYTELADRTVSLLSELIVLNRKLDRAELLAGGRFFLPQAGTTPEREPGALWAWQSLLDASGDAPARLQGRIEQFLTQETESTRC